MWTVGGIPANNAHMMGSHRPFHSKAAPECTKPLPNLIFGNVNLDQIHAEKKFEIPQQSHKESLCKSGDIYERCSKFINNSNGYPNNLPKDHNQLLENTQSKMKHKKYNKKALKRNIWHKPTLQMELCGIDEVGIDVCNDLAYSPAPETVSHTATLGDFLVTAATSSSPIDCLGQAVCSKILRSLSSSPICIQIGKPIFFSISPPRSLYNQRKTSECLSEDSFIMFDDENDDDSDAMNDIEACDNDSVVDFASSCSKSSYEISKTEDSVDTKCKKVHFAPDVSLTTILPMVTWSYAYKDARKVYWENFARDRERFNNRIKQCSNILTRILNPDHRRYIFEQRFQNSD